MNSATTVFHSTDKGRYGALMKDMLLNRHFIHLEVVPIDSSSLKNREHLTFSKINRDFEKILIL